MWHVSIARLKQNAPIPTTQWGDGTRRDARRRAMVALDGVGRGETVETETRTAGALHFRRSLSDDELSALSSEWIAIPARDEFGPDSLMEARL